MKNAGRLFTLSFILVSLVEFEGSEAALEFLFLQK
jgi:hypothetical protein